MHKADRPCEADHHRSVDITVQIGGDAGQGVESAGHVMCRAMINAGYYVFGMADYRSRIRGGTNAYQVRMGERPIDCHSDPVHVAACLTSDSAIAHLGGVARDGALIYDDASGLDASPIEDRGVHPMPVPLSSIAQEAGSKAAVNIAALGAAMGLIGLPIDALRQAIEERFASKGAGVVSMNTSAAERAYEHTGSRRAGRFAYRLSESHGLMAHGVSAQRDRVLITGNHAFCLGAVAAGCRFVSAYPMTPATTIIEWMAAHSRELGIAAIHAEDEIAAACMAVGASLAGVRAMTSTSGGGFCLMTEAIGMAAMTEAPLVVVDVQRGGPSTGLPTRTEQSDLLLAFHPSHGDFPHIVLAPGNVEQCFETGWRAFNLAEKYQCPVIMLLDAHVGGSLTAVDRDVFSWDAVARDRGSYLESLDGPAPAGGAGDEGRGYRRYAFTESGVSPRVAFGTFGGVHAPSTDEHDEEGHITEEVGVRVAMMQKRMRKRVESLSEMRPPARYCAQDADVTLLTWGSVIGAAREAAQILSQQGVSANVLHYTDVWPLSDDATQAGMSARILVDVEQNYSGQLSLIRRAAGGRVPDFSVLKYDGRQISPQEIAKGVLEGLGRVRRSDDRA